MTTSAIYLDSCAIVKMIVLEDESGALLDWLDEHPDDPVFSSVLSEVEVPRALRRYGVRVLASTRGVLTRIDRLEVDADVRATAAAYSDPHLRSPDAIHLATADMLVASGRTLLAFVTYDKRLRAAAADAGMPVAAPGNN